MVQGPIDFFNEQVRTKPRQIGREGVSPSRTNISDGQANHQEGHQGEEQEDLEPWVELLKPVQSV